MNEQTPVRIRRASTPDADIIAQFNVEMALETEHKTLEFARVQRGVSRMLADPALGFYLIAEANGNVAGCLAITFEWSDWRDGLFWWIQSVYVLPSFRRLGVFRTLYDHTVRLARQDGNICGIRLYVERDNTRAQQTYTNLGMIRAAYRIYEVEFD